MINFRKARSLRNEINFTGSSSHFRERHCFELLTYNVHIAFWWRPKMDRWDPWYLVYFLQQLQQRTNLFLIDRHQTACARLRTIDSVFRAAESASEPWPPPSGAVDSEGSATTWRRAPCRWPARSLKSEWEKMWWYDPKIDGTSVIGIGLFL